MINQLVKGIKEKDAPIVVGLDPMLSYVPKHLVKDAFAAYGETLEGACADEVRTVESFESKAENSPFLGAQLYGKVKYTICDGKVVYRG